MTENNALKIKVLVYVSHPLAILWEQKSIGANSFLEIWPRIKKSYLDLEADFDDYFFGQRDRIKFHPNRQRSTLDQKNNTLIFSPVA